MEQGESGQKGRPLSGIEGKYLDNLRKAPKGATHENVLQATIDGKYGRPVGKGTGKKGRG